MNPKTAAQWIEAHEWIKDYRSAPRILVQEAEKHFRQAIRQAKPVRPRVRLPKGVKLETLPKLKKELDRVFSIFIRSRDALQVNIGVCVTCGHIAAWREMDCGHYIPRQDLSTRWEEKNCHLQCKSCNGFRGGEAEKMAAYIDRRYVSGTAIYLRQLAKITFRPSRDWLKSRITYYKKQIGEGAPALAAPAEQS